MPRQCTYSEPHSPYSFYPVTNTTVIVPDATTVLRHRLLIVLATLMQNMLSGGGPACLHNSSKGHSVHTGACFNLSTVPTQHLPGQNMMPSKSRGSCAASCQRPRRTTAAPVRLPQTAAPSDSLPDGLRAHSCGTDSERWLRRRRPRMMWVLVSSSRSGPFPDGPTTHSCGPTRSGGSRADGADDVVVGQLLPQRRQLWREADGLHVLHLLHVQILLQHCPDLVDGGLPGLQTHTALGFRGVQFRV